MTSTWNRNTDTNAVPHLGDEDFGSFRGGRSYFYARRNAKGRFVRSIHIDQITVENLPLWNAGGLGHANENCAAASGTPVATDLHGAGFLCSACVHVPVFDPFSTTTKHGEQECARCEQVLPVTKFPTVHDGGVVTRGTTCRACRDAAAKPRRAPAPWQRQSWFA